MDSIDVYVRNEGIVDEDETWDDRLLIEAYNKSVNRIKKKIARRMGHVNGTDDNLGDEKEASNEQNVTKKNQNKNVWKAGDFCRSVYSGDGLEYEAKILQIFHDGLCLVKYLGYNNEETVKLKDLKKSLGKKTRVKQELATTASEFNNGELSDSFNENFNDEKIPEKWSPVPVAPVIPPPPPLNILSQSCIPESESEALSTMLMSWYMAGYHSGYYQGLMQSKKESQKFSKK